MMRSLLAPLVLVVLVPGCGSLECTEIGCTESFRWLDDVPLPYSDVRTLDVRACRNDRCLEASLDVLDPREPATNPLAGIALVDPAAPDAATGASLTVTRLVDGSYRIDVVWNVADATDGDRYLVEVTDPSGAVVIGLAEQPVEYDVSFPNGPSCPGECRSISIAGSTIAPAL